MMNADPIQNELNVISQRWSEVTNFFGTAQYETINGFECQKYKVQVDAQVKQKRKVTKQFDQTYEAYFSQRADEEKKLDNESHVRVTKDETKQIESQLWLS